MPLSAIAHIEQRAAPLLITHFGQFPATTISFNTAPGYSLGAAITAIQQAESEVGLPIELHHRIPRHRGGISVLAEQ